MSSINQMQAVKLLNDFLATATDSVQKVIFHRLLRAGGTHQLTYFNADFLGMVFAHEHAGVITAQFFADRRKKCDIYARFTSKNELESYIQQWVEGQLSAKAMADERKQARKDAKAQLPTAQDVLSVGDVFTCSWGYEQTNVDYYQVVGFKGKQTLLLRAIAKQITQNDFDRGECVPSVDNFISEDVFEKRASIQKSTDGEVRVYVKLSSFEIAKHQPRQADGTYRPTYWSSYA